MPRTLAFACLALLACGRPVSAQGTLWVVDPGDPTAQPDIATAVAAAAADDAVLVTDGTYGGFNLTQPIAVVAERGARVTVNTSVRADAMTGGSPVLLRGLTIRPPFVRGARDPLLLVDIQNPVWVEAVQVGSCCGPVGAALRAMDLEHLVVSRADLIATVQTGLGGLELQGSRCHAYGSRIEGSWGSEFFASGPGIRAVGSDSAPAFLSLQGCHAIEGGFGIISSWALLLQSLGGVGYDARYLDCVFTSYRQPPIGTQGAGNVTALSGDAPTFEAESPVRAGQSLTLTFRGRPGTRVYTLVATAPARPPVWLGQARGALLVDPQFAAVDHGALPATGSLSITLSVPALPAGVDFVHLYLQGFSVSPLGEAVLGYPSAVTVLNQRF